MRKIRLDHLKQDQEKLVIKIFSERKKVNLDNSIIVLIPLDSWTSGLLVYKELLSNCSSKGDFKFEKESQEIREKKRSGTHELKRLYKVGLSARVESSAEEQSVGEEDASKHRRNIADIDADAEITLVDETAEDRRRFDDQEMFDTRVLDDEEVVVEKAVAVKEVDVAQDQVSAATTTIVKDLTVDDITLAKALEALKTSKPKIRGIVVRDHKEPSESITIPTLIVNSTRPKAKGIFMEEPSEATTTTIPIPSKVQDREEAQKALEANIVVIEQWHDVHAKIEADFELAQRIQAEEQEQLTIDKKARLFMKFLEKRRKTELVEESSKKAEESSSKRARDELEQENAKSKRRIVGIESLHEVTAVDPRD
uniref:Uncharacterized protein n=1 Tax=Tanacetum cinerariifolium TaxID=118510 RepID=A0A6L2NWH0_TANCI|nr:hypothetical protein [Tanacetum cinerariifolium]